MEPSDGVVEAGCQGTMRVEVRTTGVRAHSARSWMGDNAIHEAGEVLDRLAAYEPREVEVDGLDVPRGPQRGAASAAAWPATSSPTSAWSRSTTGSRPDRSADEAEAHVREVFDGFDVDGRRRAPRRAPRPGRARWRRRSSRPSAARRGAKFGWTDVARFAALGIPAVNFGPGDPNLAHKRDEHVEIAPDRRGRACARWRSAVWHRACAERRDAGTSRLPMLRPLGRRVPDLATRRHGRAAARPGPAAPRADPRRHHRPAAARLPRPVRLGAHRPVARAAHPGGVRRGLRRARRAAGARCRCSARRARRATDPEYAPASALGGALARGRATR